MHKSIKSINSFFKNKLTIATLTLAAITLIAGLILSLLNSVTAPQIKKNNKEKEKKALLLVLPGYQVDPEKDKKEIKIGKQKIEYWIGTKKESNESGYAFKCEKSGYSGPVTTMVGVDRSFKVLGIKILKQTETPGLGARSEEIASKLTIWKAIYNFFTGQKAQGEPTVPWFQKQFSGLDLNKPIQVEKKGDWNIKIKEELLKNNAVSAITGATITTNTVKDSIENQIKILKKHFPVPAKVNEVE